MLPSIIAKPFHTCNTYTCILFSYNASINSFELSYLVQWCLNMQNSLYDYYTDKVYLHGGVVQ